MGRNLHLIQAFIIFNLFIHSSKGQLAPFCELPAERGPCNKLELRYRFSEETEYCQTFLYGGCEGNQNNFLTLKECVKRCVDEIVPQCELPKDPGSCFHANQVRYFFNEEKEICEKFYYSGCQGNSNNFRTAQECRQTCGGFPVMDDTTVRPPQVESWVEPSQPSWYSGAGSRSSRGHGSSEVTYVNPRTNRKLTFVNNNPNAPRQPQPDHNQYNSHYRNRGESSSQPAPHSYHQRNRHYAPEPKNNPPTQHRRNEQMHGQAPNPRSRGNRPSQHGSGPQPQMELSHHDSRHPPTNPNNLHNNRRPNHYPQHKSGPPMQRTSPHTPSRRQQNRQQQTNRQNQNMRRNHNPQHPSRGNSPNSPHGNQNPSPQRNEPYNHHQHQRNHNTRHENNPRRPAPGSFEQTPQGGPTRSQNNMPERPNYNWNRGSTYITTTPQTREWNNWADQSNSKTYPKPPNDWNQHNSNPPSQPGRWNAQQQRPPPENNWEMPNKYSKTKNQNPQSHWNPNQGNAEPNNNWKRTNQKPPNEWSSGPKEKPNSQFRPPSWQPPDTQPNNGGWDQRSGPPKDPRNNNNNSNNNNNQNNNHINNGPLQKLDRIPVVERREFSWGKEPPQDYSNGYNKPWNSNNNWQNNPGPSQDPTNAPSNSINRQSERTNNRQANEDQHFSESMSFKRRRGPGKGKRRPINANNRKNGRKQGRWSRNGDRYPTDSINASDPGNKNSTATDAWSNNVPSQIERRNTQLEPGNTPNERGNTPHLRGNTPHERGNTLHRRGNTQRERGNTQRESGNMQHERGNTNPHTQNVPPTPSNPPDWSISQNSRSGNIGEWSNNPTVDMNQREWPNNNAPPTTPEQPNPPNHWNSNNNIQKIIEPGPNNGKGPISHDRPPWEQPVDNQGPGLQWLSSNSNNNNNNNQKEPPNTNNNKEWQSSHTNTNAIPPSPTPTWNNNNEAVEQPFGGGPPMFEWLSKDTVTPQANNNNVNNYKRNSKPKDNTQNSQAPWNNSPSDPVPHLENFSAADIIKKQRIKPPSSNSLPMAQDPSTTLQPQNKTWSTFDSNGAYVVPMTSEPNNYNNNNNHNSNNNNNNNIYNNNNNNNNINNNEIYPSSFYPTPTNSFPEFLNGPPQRRAFEYQPTRLSPQSTHEHPNHIPESRTLNKVCYLHKDNGSCHDNVLVYYYDHSERRCKIFHYTGCGGNGNKFFSRESCESRCQVQKRPVCEQDSDPGTCNRHIIKYFFNKITRRCEVYTYTGCEGNDNRFDRFDDCLATCVYKPSSGGMNKVSKPMTGGGGGRCEQPIDEGTCTEWTKKYAYNSKTRDCEPFNYGGCGGNSNSFNDIHSCRSTCVL